MAMHGPFVPHREVVRPEWIDYNGHMNVAYYLVGFDHAVDAFLDYIGLDEAYRQRTGATTFAAECHVTYQRELVEGDPLRVATRLLAYDAKRIHFFQQMFHGERDYLAATSEWLSLHVDLETRRVAPMPAEITARLAELHAAQRCLPLPAEVGRVIGIGAAPDR